jgi:hypothetical protein
MQPQTIFDHVTKLMSQENMSLLNSSRRLMANDYWQIHQRRQFAAVTP